VDRTFDALVDEAAEVSVEGWDFSWLDGRATEERPSWGYQRLLSQKLATATAALDIQTGGGEVLAGAGAENFPSTLVATEGWPPNVAKATARLHPLGAVVVADPEEPPLPFADVAFDLVTSRHPATVHWTEIARVLTPGGTYFAQHVGSGTSGTRVPTRSHSALANISSCDRQRKGWLLIPTPITTAPMCSNIRSPPRQREKACGRPDDR
jgi:SAM-dependent methyltransferase